MWIKPMTIKEAKDGKFTIDNCTNPPVAYKGPRFDPTEIAEISMIMDQRVYDSLQNIMQDKPEMCRHRIEQLLESAYVI